MWGVVIPVVMDGKRPRPHVEEEDAVDDDAVKKNDKEAGDDGLSDKFNNLKLEMRI